jgi:palmitoyltransferase
MAGTLDAAGPWINNCVGHYNHKTFVLFCFYAVMTITSFHILYAVRFYHLLREDVMKTMPFVVLLVSFCIYIPVTVAIGALLWCVALRLPPSLHSLSRPSAM